MQEQFLSSRAAVGLEGGHGLKNDERAKIFSPGAFDFTISLYTEHVPRRHPAGRGLRVSTVATRGTQRKKSAGKPQIVLAASKMATPSG